MDQVNRCSKQVSDTNRFASLLDQAVWKYVSTSALGKANIYTSSRATVQNKPYETHIYRILIRSIYPIMVYIFTNLLMRLIIQHNV